MFETRIGEAAPEPSAVKELVTPHVKTAPFPMRSDVPASSVMSPSIHELPSTESVPPAATTRPEPAATERPPSIVTSVSNVTVEPGQSTITSLKAAPPGSTDWSAVPSKVTVPKPWPKAAAVAAKSPATWSSAVVDVKEPPESANSPFTSTVADPPTNAPLVCSKPNAPTVNALAPWSTVMLHAPGARLRVGTMIFPWPVDSYLSSMPAPPPS